MGTVEAGDKQEWSPVQPSTENSVKVMTIHQAKGLEFGTVFVPGMARDLFPNLMVQQNPAERGKSLDFELRGDARILPAFKGNLRHFWLALRDYEEMEERRTCYVSLTRAKRRGLLRNAAIVLGNRGDPASLPALRRALRDPEPLVREAARWAIERIQESGIGPAGKPAG